MNKKEIIINDTPIHLNDYICVKTIKGDGVQEEFKEITYIGDNGVVLDNFDRVNFKTLKEWLGALNSYTTIKPVPIVKGKKIRLQITIGDDTVSTNFPSLGGFFIFLNDEKQGEFHSFAHAKMCFDDIVARISEQKNAKVNK